MPYKLISERYRVGPPQFTQTGASLGAMMTPLRGGIVWTVVKQMHAFASNRAAQAGLDTLLNIEQWQPVACMSIDRSVRQFWFEWRNTQGTVISLHNILFDDDDQPVQDEGFSIET